MNPPNRKPMVLILSLVMLTVSACGLMDILDEFTPTPTSDVDAQVLATLKALEEEKDAVETETPTGTITGQVAYPSEFVPPLRVVAFDQQDESIFFVTELPAGGTYSLEVPAGTYVVLAYLMDPAAIGATPGLGAVYSEAVLCGLLYGCDDHSLVPVVVNAGQTVANIDPVDWYTPPGETVGRPNDPLQQGAGAIAGSLGFPSEYIPPLRVVAFSVYTGDIYHVDTELNQSSYQLEGLPPGTYQVVAYVRDEGPDMSGAYSYFVTCGMTADCTNHQLQDVFVYAGETTPDVDPVDFYASPDESGWPANPTE